MPVAGRWQIGCWLALSISMAVGCVAQTANQLAEPGLGPEHVSLVSESASARAEGKPAEVAKPQAMAPDVAAAAKTIAAPVKSAPTVEDAKALGAALATLEAQGAIDEAAQQQLLEGMKQTDPALWPQMASYLQSAAKLRERRVEQVTEAKPQETVPPPKAEEAPKQVEPIEPPPTKEEPKPVEKPTEPVKPVITPEPSEVDWQQNLSTAIERLEKETASPPASSAEISRHAALRMMYLAAGRREEALKPIEGIPAAQQDFWSKELYGLSTYLNTERNPDLGRRAAEAGSHLRDASARISEIATLQVKNLTFCTEVTSYGVYKAFDKEEFAAGQEALLYAEIENFKSEPRNGGFHTALKTSYQILDERGARVDEKEFAVTEEQCQNPRRDFFVRYFIWMPQRIYGGTYTLQVTVEDTLSQKIGQASVEFKIVGSGQ